MKLVACSSCARQYDATDLAPGSRIRCVCDELFLVEHRRPLGVAALQCRHCGGAVGAGDAACPYCHAKLSALDRRESTLCPACFARIEDDARHCRACGVAIAPQALTPIQEGTTCPRCCGGLLNRALGETEVVECGDCGGLWLRPQTFDRACRDAVRHAVEPLPNSGQAPPPGEPGGGPTYIRCLTCGELMVRRQFRQAGRSSRVIVDFCRDHGVWLDAHELEAIVTFLAEGGGRGPDLTRSGAARAHPGGGAGSPAPGPLTRPRGAGTFAAEVIVEVVEILGRMFRWNLF